MSDTDALKAALEADLEAAWKDFLAAGDRYRNAREIRDRFADAAREARTAERAAREAYLTASTNLETLCYPPETP